MKLGVPKKAVEKSDDVSETRNSFHPLPPQDVATQASVRVLSPLARRSKYTTATKPFWPTATQGNQLSKLGGSLLIFFAADQVTPPSMDLLMNTSVLVCRPSGQVPSGLRKVGKGNSSPLRLSAQVV